MKCCIVLIGVVVFSYFSLNGQVNYEVNVDDYNKVIELNKKAQELMRNAQIEKAIDVLSESIALDSILRETYILVFQAWKGDKECSEKAVRILQKGTRIFERDDELCYYIGEIYRNCSKYAEAILEYTNAMLYAKDNEPGFFLVPYYYYNRANCFYKMEMYGGAIDDYTEVLKLSSDFGSVYINRGICFYLIGEKAKACADWEMAISLDYQEASGYIDKYCK